MLYCENCQPKTLHCIEGTTIFHNGNKSRWKKFVDGSMTLEQAKEYAIHLEWSVWGILAKSIVCD